MIMNLMKLIMQAAIQHEGSQHTMRLQDTTEKLSVSSVNLRVRIEVRVRAYVDGSSILTRIQILSLVPTLNANAVHPSP